jgi:uncharacterized protein
MNRLAIACLMAALSVKSACGQLPPVADHHQHLISPGIAALLSTGSRPLQTITAKDLLALLDSAGIQRALLLSVAYMYGSPARTVEDEYAKVRAENDWTAAQAAQYPKRLRAFCSFNPLKEYAPAELDRCAREPRLHHGIKLHFGNSDVQLDNPVHVEQLRRMFRAANEYRMAIVVHLRANIAGHRPYGIAQAHALLDQLLPLAPDVPVQIAHLAGTAGYSDPKVDSVMAVLAEAVERRDPRTRNLWFDITTVALPTMSTAEASLVVRRIRQVGVDRILYGSDAAAGGNLPPREGWAAFRRLPLTAAEFDTMASNVAPYFR